MAQKILVVENSLEWRELLTQVVEGMGYEARVADRAAEALKVLQKEPVALLLLDIKMPVIHGDSFLKHIRRHGCKAPVIVVSGYLTPRVVEALKRYGVQKVIMKPFKVRRLAADISAAIGASDA